MKANFWAIINIKKVFIAYLLTAVNYHYAPGQTLPVLSNDSARLDWFKQAKFGIFLHWGVYSVGKDGASWPLFSGKIAQQDYIAQGKQFTAVNYDPHKWAQLFKASGARYAVLTAMHCDGVALWPTKANNSSMQGVSPYKKDLIGPYCDALHEAGLKVGLYYSHVDWSAPGYMTLTQNMTVSELQQAQKVKYDFQKNWDSKGKEGYYGQKKFNTTEAATWNRFIKRHDDQIDELVNNYKVDLLWFDFMYPNGGDFKWGEKALKERLIQQHPSLIVNGRIGNYGDYETPERGMPVVPPADRWELCETLNNDWSYVLSDTDNKPVRQVLRMLVECISMGGNLLLGIGPKADGSFQPEQEKRILEIGKWVKAHEDAVYETKRGIASGHFYGPTSLSPDNKSLYLYLLDDPKDEIQIKGIRNRIIKKISIVGRPDVELKYKYLSGASWAGIPPILAIPVPHAGLDDNITVVKIEFNEPIDLYRGKGKDIINN